jgi:hypothetical protein
MVLTLVAPSHGISGSTLSPTASFTVSGTYGIVGDLGQPVNVVIVRNGMVVGAYTGAEGGTGVSVGAQARSSHGQPIPVAPVLLSGCPAANVDYAHPDATRHALPAGAYQLIATMEAGGYGVASSVIVSTPVPIQVTG